LDQGADLGRAIPDIGEALKIQKFGKVGVNADTHLGTAHPHDGGVGLDNEVRLFCLKDFGDHRQSHAPEHLQDRVAFAAADHIFFDNDAAPGGNG
jgi:hypothetical protein